ncbi:MAG: hypothetical protein MJZ34_02960 [Paludibacteraceae bacterium]|nr:hypothetical protein [Paludibacteraceae bacterium]
MYETLNFVCTNWGKAALAAAITGEKIKIVEIDYSPWNADYYDEWTIDIEEITLQTTNVSLSTTIDPSGENSFVNIFAQTKGIPEIPEGGSTVEVRSVAIIAEYNGARQPLAYAAVGASEDPIYIWTNTVVSFSNQIKLAVTAEQSAVFDVTSSVLPVQPATINDAGLVQLATKEQVAAGTQMSVTGIPLVVQPGTGFSLKDDSNNDIWKVSGNIDSSLIEGSGMAMFRGEQAVEIDTSENDGSYITIDGAGTGTGVVIGGNLTVNKALNVRQLGTNPTAFSTDNDIYPVGCLFLGFYLITGGGYTKKAAGDVCPIDSTHVMCQLATDSPTGPTKIVTRNFPAGSQFKALTSTSGYTSSNNLALFVRIA